MRQGYGICIELMGVVTDESAGTGRDENQHLDTSPAHVRRLVHDERRGPVRTRQGTGPPQRQNDGTLREAWQTAHCEGGPHRAGDVGMMEPGRREQIEGALCMFPNRNPMFVVAANL